MADVKISDLVTTTRDVEWKSYAPVITATTTNPTLGSDNVTTALYRVVGKTLYIKFETNQSNGGVAGNGVYFISIPSGYQIDLTKCPLDASALSVGSGTAVRTNMLPLGQGLVVNISSAQAPFTVYPKDSTRLCFMTYLSNMTQFMGANHFSISNGNRQMTFTCEIPIV